MQIGHMKLEGSETHKHELLQWACRMQDRTFDSACAQQQIQATNLSLNAIEDCMGSSDADTDHPLLQVSRLLCNNTACSFNNVKNCKALVTWCLDANRSRCADDGSNAKCTGCI